MAITKITESPWNYILYCTDNRYILSVVCGTSALYELNIPLSADETTLSLSDPSYLDCLAAEIRSNPHVYSPRSIEM